MLLFNKKKRITVNSKVLDKYAAAFLLQQRRYCDWLSRRFSAWPLGYKRIAVISCCLLSTTFSVYILLHSFDPMTLRKHPTIIQRSSMPSHIGRNNHASTPMLNVDPVLSLLDSLAANDSMNYQRLLTARPGLLDSIKHYKKYHK